MDFSETVLFGGLVLLAYLLGSIPFGLILVRAFAGIDIRRQGSGNIGATNVRRLAGTPLGLLTLAGDVLKGAGPVYLAHRAGGFDPFPNAVLVSAVALAAFAGHLFPFFLKLKGGGKGVATAAGCFAVISPAAVGLALGIFILVVWLSRKVSAGSLAAALTLPPAVWWTSVSPPYTLCALLMAAAIFLRHMDNIRRLLSGREPDIGQRSNRP